ATPLGAPVEPDVKRTRAGVCRGVPAGSNASGVKVRMPPPRSRGRRMPGPPSSIAETAVRTPGSDTLRILPSHSVVPGERSPVGVALLQEGVAALDGLVGHV